jgi:hypothetical protein
VRVDEATKAEIAESSVVCDAGACRRLKSARRRSSDGFQTDSLAFLLNTLTVYPFAFVPLKVVHLDRWLLAFNFVLDTALRLISPKNMEGRAELHFGHRRVDKTFKRRMSAGAGA